MKKVLILLVIGIGAFYGCSRVQTANTAGLKEGDIVFQTSKSKQAPLVALATRSAYTHCGIIVFKGDQPYVLEASTVVKCTPYREWVERGVGKVCHKRRVFKNKDIKIRYKQYLGKSYDLQFKFNNGKYYCSELVYEIYKEQFDTELCTPKKVKQYYLPDKVKRAMKRRNIQEDQLVVAPCDLL